MHRYLIIAVLAVTGLHTTTMSAGDTLTVCPAGCDYTTIQDAIDAASLGDTISIGEVGVGGEFYENKINTNGKPLTIQGQVGTDGTLLTTISGQDRDVDENSSVFYFNSGEDSSTVIRDLIIADGNAHGYAGGIQIFNCSPTISSCTITGNSALYRNDGSEASPTGGGIYLSGSDSLIVDCTITGNFAQWEGMNDASGGGIYCTEGEPTLRGCHITDNSIYYTGHDPCGNCEGPQCGQAEGMGIAGYKTTLTIIDCVIEGNSVLNQFMTACDSNSSQIASNGGALWFKESTVSITDTVISNNWARINGGIYSDQCTLILHRCEISGNNDTGIYLFEGWGTFSQCLIEANTFAGIAMSKDTTLSLSDTRITGNSIGVDVDKECLVDIFRSVISDNSYEGGQGGISLLDADDSTSVTLSESHLCGNPVGNAGALTSNQVNPIYPTSQVTVDAGTVVSGLCQTTISVEQDGTGDFTDIQDAIDAAPIGATVSIGAGTWPGGWTTRARPINIKGTPDIGNPPATIIDGGGSGTVITIAANGNSQTTISDLQIVNGSNPAGGAGMFVNNANLTITNCIFQQNQSASGGGGILFMASTATLDGCQFIQNRASPGGGGAVFINGASSVTTTGCRFNENTGGTGGGAIWVDIGGNLTCRDSSFKINSILRPPSLGGAIGIAFDATADLTDNYFCGNTPDQISGDYTDGGDNILENECMPDTVTVAGDGSAQYDTITEAIGAVGDGSIIQIAAGDYAEELNTLGKAIRLVGSVNAMGLSTTRIFAPQIKTTILTCDSGEVRTTIFENLTFESSDQPFQGSGGINCSGTSPTFINCMILDNFGANAGGMYCENGSSPLLYKCVFRQNTGGSRDSAPGGISSVSGSNPELRDCIMCDNYTDTNAPINIGGTWTDLGNNELWTECSKLPCIADINRDGMIDSADLAYILENWGSDDTVADLTGDGQVDAADLGLVIATWGTCY
jgi:pectin methylesterase-like acyl-CoA thioesterase